LENEKIKNPTKRKIIPIISKKLKLSAKKKYAIRNAIIVRDGSKNIFETIKGRRFVDTKFKIT